MSFEEINSILPSNGVETELIESIMTLFSGMSVYVVEHDPKGSPTSYEATPVKRAAKPLPAVMSSAKGFRQYRVARAKQLVK